MRLLPWQDAIMDELRSALGVNIDVLDGGYGESEEPARLENGMIRPYVLVWFGGSIDAGPGFATIGGVRQASRQGYLHVECVGTTMTHARQLGDLCRDALHGFRPDGEGELEEDGAPSIRNPISTTTGVDVRYSYPLAFHGVVNTTTA
jgi:hypothetical protein